jgi:type I restriction enzyme S subunit
VTTRREVLGAEIASTDRHRCTPNQFIVSRIDARNGAFGLIPPDLAGAVVTNDFPLFNVDAARLDPSFLGWLCKTAGFVELCKAASEGTTNRVRLKEDTFLATAISLPPLGEQRRIVSRVDAIAARIADARRLREEADAETSTLTNNARHGLFERHRCPLVPLVDVCSAVIDNLHSNPVYSDSGVPCVRSSDVGWGTLDLSKAMRTDEAEFKRRTVRGVPSTDDIVLVREGGGTGKAALVRDGEGFSLGQRVMIRPDKAKVLPRFFLHQLLSPTIQRDQIQRLTTGSAAPHLNIGDLKQFPFACPDLVEQRRIVAHLDALQAKADAVRSLQAEASAELDALLPAVLAKAFAGEL